MDDRNINEEDNMAYDRDATLSNKQQTNKVGEQIKLPEVTNNIDKLLAESQPQGKPFVSAMDRARIRNKIDPVRKINAITNEQDVKNILANAKATAINKYNADKTERDKQAKADAEAREQEEKEAKHRKAEKMWAAIGDGISAIANMTTVGAGADSMYNPDNSLHSKVKSKWDEIKANKAAIAAAENKARMDLLLNDLGYKHQASENEKNRQSRWAEYIDKAEETKRHNQEMEDIARNRAESYSINANANKTRADKYKGGGSGGTRGGKNSQGKWEIIGPDGNPEYYDTQAEWEARAKEIAPEVGVSLTTNSGWKKVKKDAKQVVAEVNAKNRGKANSGNTTGKKISLNV